MTNYVSFSLFGDGEDYHAGAIENVKLCKNFYPDWTPVVYSDKEVPKEVLQELSLNHALVIEGNSDISQNKRAWRFAATLIEDAEKVVFRDTDSRISAREKACVDRWLGSGKALHIMRDHPHHSSWIMAGMWGVDAKSGAPYIKRILSMANGLELDEDQRLLARELYYYLGNQSMVHDSFFQRERWAHVFPEPRVGGQFVGERIDEKGNPEINMRELLERYENNKFLVLKLLAIDFLRTKTYQSPRLRNTV